MKTARIVYFKTSGKFYTEASIEVRDDARLCDVVAQIRGLATSGGPGAMPGLSGDGWDGTVLVEVGSVPALLTLTRSKEPQS